MNYWAILRDAKVGVTEKGTPYLEMKFTVTHEEGFNDWQKLDKPIQAPVYFYLTEKSIDKTMETLKDRAFNGNFDHPEFDPALSSEGCELWMKEEEYDGKTIEKWHLSNGRKQQAVDRDIINNLNAIWKQKYPTIAKPISKPPVDNDPIF